MPRKAALKPGLTLPAEETILREPKIQLSLEERGALRVIFKHPAYLKAWKNAQHSKPGVFTADLNTPLGSIIANNRLHEIRGWELLEAALQRQIVDPVLKKPTAPDNFPDAGAIGAEFTEKK